MVPSSCAAAAVPTTRHGVDRIAGLAARLTVAAVLAVALLPLAFGACTLVVLSGSMAPALRVGDLVVVRAVPAAAVRAGDVVTFRDPAGSGRLVTHRVRSVVRAGSSLRFVTRGDAARAGERWQVSAAARVGLVRCRVPAVGYPLARVRSVFGRVALLGAVAVVALGWTAWRRRAAAA